MVVLVLLVAAAFALRYFYGHRSAGAGSPLGAAGEPTAATPRVEVIKATVIASDRALSLPGVVRPLEETKIFPRISGYVKKWHVDIGDKVTEGQLLAEVDSPELDAQLVQARAQVAQAIAAVKQSDAQRAYSKSNATRYASLADQKLVSAGSAEQAQSQSQVDEASYRAQQANVDAAEANVHRLVDLLAYAKVTAPFAGTITARWVDRGSALVADSNQTPMFQLDATDPVRVFVDIPQTVASTVKPGTAAKISLREAGDRAFDGTVARSAGALDPVLHTMMTELRVPNPDGALMPGMYVQAAMTLPVPHRVLEVPATVLYNDAQGLRIGVVDAQHHLRLVPITIERDTGATLWIGSGLTGDEQIVKIAVPTLGDGDSVEVAPAAAPAPSSDKK